MRFARAMRLIISFFWSGVIIFLLKKKIENIGLSGPVLLPKKKKKKPMSLFFIYNFYFENLIYKWIKQFENQQESDPIF